MLGHLVELSVPTFNAIFASSGRQVAGQNFFKDQKQ
jgi:hypothetical protein